MSTEIGINRVRRTALAGLAALAAAATLTACGFQLRGPRALPFDSLYIAMPEGSPLAAQLKRTIRASSPNTRIADSGNDAQAILLPTVDAKEKVILSLNAAGRVREYQLKQRFGFRVHNGKDAEFLAPVEIVITRDFTFNDSDLLGKDAEEQLIYRDMQNDLVQQILRRLQAAKLAPATPAAQAAPKG